MKYLTADEMGTDEMGTASKAGDVTCTNEKGSEKLFAPGLLDSTLLSASFDLEGTANR